MPLVLKAISFQSASMGEGAEKVFDERGGTFGRSKSCDWVLPDPERYISGTHGKVFFENGRYFVTDTSTNGLIIEGQAAPIGKGKSVPLSHGDVLLLGEFRLQVFLEEEAGHLGDAGMVEAQGNEPLGAETRGSLDPLDFLLPESPSSTGDRGVRSESQADDSSIAHDHFEAPRVGGRELAQPIQSPRQDPAPAPVAPEQSKQSDATPLHDFASEGDSGELIGEDWDVTDLGSESGDLDPTDDEPKSHTGSGSLNSAAGQPQVDAKPALEPEALFEQIRNTQNADHSFNAAPEMELSPDDIGADLLHRTEPAAHQSPSNGGLPADESKLVEAFVQGLGIRDASTLDCSVETMRSYGALLRLMIGSLMDLLSARTDFKNEFRLSRTVLKPEENNPLKFSPNVDEALRIFLSPNSSGYLGLEESVRESLVDMKYHQVALIAGLQAIFREFNSLMRPERYTAESDGGVKALLQSITQKSRNWQQFCAYCERLESESSNGIFGHFSDIFAEAYEERIIMLGNVEKGSN